MQSLKHNIQDQDIKQEFKMLIRQVATLKESLLGTFESKKKIYKRQLILSLIKRSYWKHNIVTNSKTTLPIRDNEIQVSLKSITKVEESLRSSANLNNNFSDMIKDIEDTLEETMKNLDNNVRLGKDLEQWINELWKILEKNENLHKWQQVVPSQSYARVLQ